MGTYEKLVPGELLTIIPGDTAGKGMNHQLETVAMTKQGAGNMKTTVYKNVNEEIANV